MQMNRKLPRVTVIIPVRNEEEYIGGTLKSILNCDYPHSLLEILVVDGMSEDSTREIVEKFKGRYPFIKVLDNPAKIVPVAMNIGIKNATGEIIIRMDAHTEYERDYISKCVEYLEKTKADNVGGPLRPRSKTFLQKAISLAVTSIFGVGNAKFHFDDKEGYVDTVTYGAFRREVFERVGLFDEELVRNQDDELNYRIIKSGGRIYLTPEIKSYYYPRSSLRKLWKQYFEYGYWKVRVIEKHQLPASWRHLVPGTFVMSIFISLLLSLSSVWGIYGLILILGSYSLLSLIFSIRIAIKNGLRFLPVLPIVFATLHLSYGFGFIKGTWDFVIAKKFKKLKSFFSFNLKSLGDLRNLK
jgi:glycosyltransferase involved in cell wall biosynthesis